MGDVIREGSAYVAAMAVLRRIAERLAAPDLLAPEAVELARAIRMADGDPDRVRTGLFYAAAALRGRLPESPLLGEAEVVLGELDECRG